jgi:hypothetical protein
MIKSLRVLHIRILMFTVTLCLVLSGPSAAQGVWFDISSGNPALIHCAEDTSSWMEFASYPFGETWPPGTLVHAELDRREDSNFAVVYSIKFNDGGCGCGRDLYKPVAFRFHYDESAVTWPEASTTLYRRDGVFWKKETAILDTETNVFSGSYWGFVVGTPTFGIGPPDAFEEVPSSWGRVKALYGGGN